MRKQRKWVRYMFILVLILILMFLVAHTVVVVSGGSHILSLKETDGKIVSGLPEQKTDCILILGAGLRNGEPSLMLQERLDLGAALYYAGASNKILVTGDNSAENYNEPQAMEEYLVNVKGVPREDIVRDHAGFSTYDSIFRAKEIFCADSVIIVTQKYHLFRATYIASRLGLKAYGADAQKSVYFGRHYREARECLARVKDFFACAIKHDPKYLGEKLPINP